MEKKSIGIILQTSLIVVFAFFALACASQKYFGAVDGSKADGTVTVVYEVGMGIGGNPNDEIRQNALQEARTRCKAWGYSDAVFLGKEYRTSPPEGGARYIWKCQCIY